MADGRSVWTGLVRGARGRCPNCDQGPIFCKYLSVLPNCRACGHDLAVYPADDAPPYFTILIVGHLVIAPMLIFKFIETWPLWLVLATTLPALAALTLTLLPIIKGATIGACWALGFKRPDMPGPAVGEAEAKPAVDPRAR